MPTQPTAAGLAARVAWQVAVIVTLVVTTLSWEAGAAPGTVALRAVIAGLGVGILGWGVAAVLAAGEARSSAGDEA